MTQASMFATDVAPPLAGQYHVLYADWPWPERGGGQIKRGADRHYALMSMPQILDLAATMRSWPAEDAHCYLWATNNYLPDAFDVLKVMGFRYVSCVTWIKDRPGLGQYFRGRTEHCLFGVRGRLPYRTREDTGKRAQGETVCFEPDLPDAFEAARTVHSRKPQIMREYIERVSAGPYLELFARQAAPNWHAWGHQAPMVEA